MDLNIDLNEVEETGGGDLPAGKYHVQVETSELKPTKAGTGWYIYTMLNVIGENRNGSKAFFNFNVANPNPEAVRIGKGQLKSMVVAATGESMVITDPSQLVGMDCVIKVVEKNGESKITSFSKAAEGATTTTSDGDIPF